MLSQNDGVENLNFYRENVLQQQTFFCGSNLLPLLIYKHKQQTPLLMAAHNAHACQFFVVGPTESRLTRVM